MKSAHLLLVIVAATLYTPAQAETRRSTDSLAVQAAGASPNGDPGTGTEGDEHAINTKGTGSSGKSATGKRAATGDVDGDGMSSEAAVSSPRDAASGQATGKRQHKPSIRAADAGDETGTDDATVAKKTKPTSSSYDLKMGTK